MRVLNNKKDISNFLKLLRERASGVSPEMMATVRSILLNVSRHGDSALRKYTAGFDRHSRPLRIGAAEIRREAKKTDKRTLDALALSASRIRDFHLRQTEKSWSFRKEGAILGQIIRPLERVGIYVPGGKASYPSTVLMNVIPAQVAGVEDIALCVPAPGGEVNPYVMAAIELLGVKEVYRIGGAQAVGAMAYGTESIRRVDKIVGPGNIYVATAKRLVFGDVDIDMIAGPSEILIIADKTAIPAFAAADMLGQAEHDELASSVLITDSQALIDKVCEELGMQLKTLARRKIAEKSLGNFGAAIKTKDMAGAIALANEIAPEHLEIMTEHPEKHIEHIKHAGAVFLGQWAPEALGDYAAGPNHTLPTGGTARFSSPLGVYDFIKRTSLLTFSQKGFTLLSETVETLAGIEGLGAHAHTVRIREDFLSRTENKGLKRGML